MREYRETIMFTSSINESDDTCVKQYITLMRNLALGMLKREPASKENKDK